MRLVAFDPGDSTGWSIWEYTDSTPLTLVAHGTIKGGVNGFIRWWQKREPDYDVVVSESFILDGRTPFPNVTPLKIEGALAVLWPSFVLQRNVMKAHFKDDRIKALGLWWRGEPHSIDSMRHAFAYMKVNEHLPTIRWAWPQ